MSKVKLTSYLNKIESNYIKTREKWEKLQKELKDEETRYNSLDLTLMNDKGMNKEFTLHMEKKKDIYKKIEGLRHEFEESVQKVKSDSDKIFNKNYQYTPSEIDSNGVTILQNGDLSDRELMELAERYRKSGNYTMYFMATDKMKIDQIPEARLGAKDKEMRAYKNKARERRNSREDHELLNSFGEICLKALRDEDYLSNGIHKAHDGFYQEYKNYTDNIVSDVASPWEVSEETGSSSPWE
ncbi:hypothetical protein SAMN05660484_00230 [Eubacterium ruminantium]|uniref:Uncharacterized protein n=1 Tax=Eubacterium ruminantium TaxID=42322 RepID=A0A1T4QUZ1_9FIRM|nr:hypothetical protein [Eubacterium ruminantium]SCW28249.1 hypothetical protein SAMN05660484_00230 [Eubacterium ruminantium]SDM12186.1 hypothetical protein SAMN04490370_101112 [Eubacterium ruminantium]SKA07600.1 hypothetical protein SAMN02745110_02532 [Eubacterium ruminantium]